MVMYSKLILALARLSEYMHIYISVIIYNKLIIKASSIYY